jgi:ubiquinone/menaquinone biosynthesis C-methylase UbiE
MLALAVRNTRNANAAYVRADACALPFRDGSFDAICCFAALYLIERPMQALDEIARVLAPGGRVALLSSCNRGPLPAGTTNAVALASIHAERIQGSTGCAPRWSCSATVLAERACTASPAARPGLRPGPPPPAPP